MDVQKVYFMLMAQDMDRAVKFYSDVIGLEVKHHTENWSELGDDDSVIALHSGGDGEYRLTGLGFAVSDVAAASGEVTSGGGRVVELPAERQGEGIILARLADPEGNGFTLTQRIRPHD